MPPPFEPLQTPLRLAPVDIRSSYIYFVEPEPREFAAPEAIQREEKQQPRSFTPSHASTQSSTVRDDLVEVLGKLNIA